VAVAFGFTVPTVQTPVDILYVPWEAEAFDKLRPAGKMSFATTKVEVAGPSAATIKVYVTVAPPAGFALSTVFVIATSATVDVGVVPPPPPPQFVVQLFVAMTTGTVEELLEGFESVVEAFSPTVARFVIVVPAVPAFTVAAMFKVAVELAPRLPIVQVPVEEA
jgi:hypothetical protein